MREIKDITHNGRQLSDILDAHALWLQGEGGERASLDGARLDGVNLVGACLDRASLVGASLVGARLDGASLVGTRLVGARLVGANLVGARLFGALLDGARLDRASLVGANLDYASLDGASLDRARLNRASLDGASLVGAKVHGVTIKDFRVFSGLYLYEVWSIIAYDGSEHVRMGCFIRPRSEWEKDFWNNEQEFPNDGSESSQMRKSAFDYACKWLDMKKGKQK